MTNLQKVGSIKIPYFLLPKSVVKTDAIIDISDYEDENIALIAVKNLNVLAIVDKPENT